MRQFPSGQGDAQPPEGGTGDPRHLAQLFDAAETRADRVAAFILEGEACGEHVAIVLLSQHWALVQDRLASAHYPLNERLADGRLQLFDAAATLARIMRHGRPDPERFEQVFAGPVRELCAGGVRLRACGELVDLLAAHGEFRAVVALEQLWSALARQIPLTLLCLYGSVHFGHARSQDALRQICRAHDRIEATPADELGEWLLREQLRAFGPM